MLARIDYIDGYYVKRCDLLGIFRFKRWES